MAWPIARECPNWPVLVLHSFPTGIPIDDQLWDNVHKSIDGQCKVDAAAPTRTGAGKRRCVHSHLSAGTGRHKGISETEVGGTSKGGTSRVM